MKSAQTSCPICGCVSRAVSTMTKYEYKQRKGIQISCFHGNDNAHCGHLYYDQCGLQDTHKLGEAHSCETFLTTYHTTRRKIPKTTIYIFHKRFLDYIIFSFRADGAAHELATNQELKRKKNFIN